MFNHNFLEHLVPHSLELLTLNGVPTSLADVAPIRYAW